MIRTVLLVDDDREMLLSLREGFRRYADSMSVLLAGDGLEALEALKRQDISLVVTDLKMPRMDGFELLATIMGNYPDIPVIIITGFSTPDMEQLARQGGAVGFIAKPFLIENLARQILSMLRRETEGGTLHNVSSGMFLQLIEMEQKTCTIRLEDKTGGKRGALFFVGGELFDARVGNLQGEVAAYDIFSWEHVSLSIQNDCSVHEN
ncbi:MAG: response regulator, partial [Hyphomicrobiales bacterium]